jgi:hypothetical protein
MSVAQANGALPESSHQVVVAVAVASPLANLRGKDDRRADAAADRYEALFSEETMLVAQRINWLIGSQAFLMTAYVAALAGIPGSRGQAIASTITAAGAVSAALIGVSVAAAILAQRYWLAMAIEAAGAAENEFPLVGRAAKSRTNRLTDGMATVVAFAFPAGAILLWLLLGRL